MLRLGLGRLLLLLLVVVVVVVVLARLRDGCLRRTDGWALSQCKRIVGRGTSGKRLELVW